MVRSAAAPRTETTTTDANHETRPPGRPRDAAADQAILHAALDVIREVGIRRMTLTAVAERAGVARATVYLRWPTRDALAGAAVRAVVGGGAFRTTGDLATDINEGVLFAQRIFAAPYFRAVFPEVVRAVLSIPAQDIGFNSIAPNAPIIAREYEAGAAAQGFNPARDPDIAFDLMLGANIVRLLATGQAATPEYARQVGEVVIAGLRAK